MKDKAMVCFRHLADGNVIGDIIDETGVVVESRNFGVMSAEEFERSLDMLNKEHPNLVGKILPSIELKGN